MSLLLLSFALSVSPHRTGTLFILLQINRHNVNNGEEEVPAERHECDRCGQVYRHRTSLRRHRHQAHTGRQTCPECGEGLQGEESQARHITWEHRGHQPDGAVDGQLATILEVLNVVYHYRITYNIDCFLSKEQLTEGTNNVMHTAGINC